MKMLRTSLVAVFFVLILGLVVSQTFAKKIETYDGVHEKEETSLGKSGMTGIYYETDEQLLMTEGKDFTEATRKDLFETVREINDLNALKEIAQEKKSQKILFQNIVREHFGDDIFSEEGSNGLRALATLAGCIVIGIFLYLGLKKRK